MKPTIYLALTHDWELRGDGSGDPEEIQFAPLRRLLEIYEKFGARTTFLPDVLQQLTFRSFEGKNPELKPLAHAWDEHVREVYRKGHDVQLHLHTQWSDAGYENGQWTLRGAWSILKYEAEPARAMLGQTKSYLEDLLGPVDGDYRCVAFRASALAVAPSRALLSTLAALGIEIDVSVAAGFFLNNETLQLDYRNCEETFLPYYPKMDDARQVSSKVQPIICLPLNHFYGSRRAVTRQNLALARKRLQRATPQLAGPRTSSAQLDTNSAGLARVYEKLIRPAIKRKYFVSDTGRLDYPLMREMLGSIRQRARATGWSKVPVMLTNHPKDIRDWDGLEKFVGELSAADDVEFVRLREFAEKLKSGEFHVRAKTSHR